MLEAFEVLQALGLNFPPGMKPSTTSKPWKPALRASGGSIPRFASAFFTGVRRWEHSSITH